MNPFGPSVRLNEYGYGGYPYTGAGSLGGAYQGLQMAMPMLGYQQIGMGQGYGGYGAGYMGTLAGSGMGGGMRPPTLDGDPTREGNAPYGYGPTGMDAYAMAHYGTYGG